MAVAANKRSVMTLFSGPTDIYSHQVRIVLAEKGVSFEIEHVEKDNPPQDLIDLNPNQSVPTLVDRELTLWESRIIMEYLDERFPHPPLMPVYLVDCYLAPLLWRLPQLGIEFSGPGAKELKGYMTRVFERDSFLASLTEAEREMRLGRS